MLVRQYLKKEKTLKVGSEAMSQKMWCLLWSFVQSVECAWFIVAKRTEHRSLFRLYAQNVVTRNRVNIAQMLLPSP